MNMLFAAVLLALAATLGCGVDAALPVDMWSQRYRNWTYLPTYAIPPKPNGTGIINVQCTDVAAAWEATPAQMAIDGLPRWRMFYTFYNGTGYQGALATSTDLAHWNTSHGVVFSFNPINGSFDYGGVALGGLLLNYSGLYDPRTLRPDAKGRVWQLYGSYLRRNGDELRPGAEGAAYSDDGGMTWNRVAVNTSVMSIYGPGKVGVWEKDCIYQPYLVIHKGIVYDFYNAANGGDEQSGVATLHLSAFPGVSNTTASKWSRYAHNPVITNNNSHDANMSSDPKVYYDPVINAWTMFYFGGLRHGHADIMVAFSLDLLHWEQCIKPIYMAGGHPSGLDAQDAHKVSIVYDDTRDTLVMFYTAVDKNGVRGIAALSSRPLE